MSVESQTLRLEMVLQCLETCMSLKVKSLCSVKHYAKQDDDGVEADLHTPLTTALDGIKWYFSCHGGANLR